MLDAQPLLGPGHLVAVYLRGQPVQVGGQPPGPTAYLGQLGLAGRACRGDLVTLGGRRGEGDGDALQRDPGSGGDRLGDPGSPCPGRAAGRRPLPGGPLGRGLPGQRVGPSGQRPDPLLGGTHGKAYLHLVLPGLRHQRGELVAFLALRVVLDRRLLRRPQPLLQFRQAGHVALPGRLGIGPGGGEPVGLGAGRLRGRAQLGQPPGDRVALPVGLPAGLRGGGHLVLARGHLGLGALELGPQPLQPGAGLRAALPSLVHGRLYLDVALRLARPAGRGPGADHVTVRGDRTQSRLGGHQIPGPVQVGHEHDIAERAFQGRAYPGGAAYHVQCPAGAVGQGRPGGHRVARGGDEQGGAAGVLGFEQPYRRRHVVHRGHRYGIGERTERGGQRRLVPRVDREQRRDAAQQPRYPVPGRQQGAGPVLAAQAERERLLAGAPLGGLHLGLPLGVAQLLGAGLGRLVRTGRGGMPGDQVDVLLVQPLGLRLLLLVRLLGDLGPLPGLGRGDLMPLDLFLGGGRAAPGGVDLPGQLGQTLAPVGDRLTGLDQRLLRLGELTFQALPALYRLGQPGLVGLERLP